MIFKVKPGDHKFKPWRFWISWKKKFSWSVLFYPTCRYVPDVEHDTNKLIGFGFLPGHHKNSARFGWRYDMTRDQIELLAYVYSDSVRSIQSIGFVDFGTLHRLVIRQQGSQYEFSAAGNVVTMKGCSKRFKYGLWPYFGGNYPAPFHMQIRIEK